ncbi:MAG: DUF4835 family protein [Bacteroidales bacterium]|nr:DUF4835 family protein [Bacteroidales bacterium]
MNISKYISKALYLIALLVLMGSLPMQSQEINAKVSIDYRQIQGTNVSVFKTLEKALTEFVNNQRWTNEEYQANERIDCNFFININSSEGNAYSGSLTVSARRPIYNASISTTLLNLVDNDFSFTYNEYDQLIFNKNSLTQDLTAVFGFYVYTILGIDADSFKEFGGDSYYNDAIGIVNSAQSASGLSEKGWDRLGSKRNRHVLISELLSSEFRPYRSYVYQYHRQGLDVMADNASQGASVILSGISNLEEVASNSPSSYTMLLFFDVKTVEIQNLIREMNTDDDAIAIQKKALITTLKKLDPSRVQDYDRLSK